MRPFLWLAGIALSLAALSGNAYIVNEFNLGAGCLSYPYGLAAAPNGDVWYTCPNDMKIVRFRHSGPQGEISSDVFVLDTGQIGEQLAVGDDGIIWIAASNAIVRYDPGTGAKTFIPFPARVANGLALTIAPDGRVTAADPVGRVDPEFLAAARRHILAHWRYRPATDDGSAVGSLIIVTVSFRLDEAG